MMLPVVKLGSLLVKTISKPIASRLKKEAARYEGFRQLIISVAQANHQITTTIQRRLYGHATDVAIRPLNEEKAVQAASDLIGELFVFMVAGGAVIFEVQRSARAEARKEELRKQELEEIKRSEQELAIKVQELEQRIAELQRLGGGRGLFGLYKFRHGAPPVEAKERPGFFCVELKDSGPFH